MSKRVTLMTGVMGFCLIFLSLTAHATIQIPKLMNFQGYLTDSGGTPINGTRNLRFRLYDAGGAALNWVETHQNVPITNGIYNVVLGASGAAPVMIDETFRKGYYLEILVDHTGSGAWEAMSPRHRLSNAAYALAARKVVNQQVLVVAHDGGDTTTASGAIDMLLGQGAFTTALAPAPSVSTQWVIEIKAGQYNEPGTFGGGGSLVVPNWVTLRGAGWNATELSMSSRTIVLATGSALESLIITSDANPVVSGAGATNVYVRECKIEFASDSGAPAIDLSGAVNSDVVDTTIFYASFAGVVQGIAVAGSNNCRVENCVVDLRNAMTMGCAGITDQGAAAVDLFILENTVRYQSSGAAGSSIGIGVAGTPAPSTGRVSNNVVYGGVVAYDYWNTAIGATIAPGYGGPNGVSNQDSAGALVPAF